MQLVNTSVMQEKNRKSVCAGTRRIKTVTKSCAKVHYNYEALGSFTAAAAAVGIEATPFCGGWRVLCPVYAVHKLKNMHALQFKIMHGYMESAARVLVHLNTY